jgi:uncharacterized protein (DUF58 family)
MNHLPPHLTAELVFGTTAYGLFSVASFYYTLFGVVFLLVLGNGRIIVRRPIDAGRVEEGLPTDVALTPEDFRNNPELLEMFEITDADNNLEFNLESNEHFEIVENLEAAATIYTQAIDNYNAFHDIFEAILNAFLQ